MSDDLDCDVGLCYANVGSAECNERCRDHRQTRSSFSASAQLVHPGNVCHQWRWTLRGPWLAGQPAQEPEVGRVVRSEVTTCASCACNEVIECVCMLLEKASVLFYLFISFCYALCIYCECVCVWRLIYVTNGKCV